MDDSGYREFPFPSRLTPEERALHDYFLSLPDEDQLRLLNGSRSYAEFHDRVASSWVLQEAQEEK